MSSRLDTPSPGVLCPSIYARALYGAFCLSVLLLSAVRGAESEPTDLVASPEALSQTDALTLAAANRQWNSLAKDLSPSGMGMTLAITPATYVSSANKYRDFYTKYASSAQSKQAKCNEALLLLTARRYGDTSISARCSTLVAAIKKDKTIAERQRYKIVSVAEQVDRGVTQLRGKEQFAAMVATHKSMISQFPALSDGYEALLATADRADPASGAQLATDLRAMKQVPEGIKARAKILENRNALLGKSFLELAKPLVGSFAGLSTLQGKPVCIYTWSVDDAFSVEIGKAIAATAPVDAVIIGLNTDFNQSRAMAFAAKERVPGFIYCDGRGGFGSFAAAFELRRPGLAYATDEKGIITSVQKQWDPSVQSLAIRNSSGKSSNISRQ